MCVCVRGVTVKKQLQISCGCCGNANSYYGGCSRCSIAFFLRTHNTTAGLSICLQITNSDLT